MSEEIKAGDKVWVWLEELNVWAEDKLEIAAVGNQSFAYLSNGGRLHTTNKVATTDPHKPKTSEWMPEGCELREYSRGQFITKTGAQYSLDDLYYANEFQRLHSFAVEAENGNVNLLNSPLQFTRDDCICEQLINNTWKRAKILGAVMYLEGKWYG